MDKIYIDYAIKAIRRKTSDFKAVNTELIAKTFDNAGKDYFYQKYCEEYLKIYHPSKKKDIQELIKDHPLELKSSSSDKERKAYFFYNLFIEGLPRGQSLEFRDILYDDYQEIPSELSPKEKIKLNEYFKEKYLKGKKEIEVIKKLYFNSNYKRKQQIETRDRFLEDAEGSEIAEVIDNLEYKIKSEDYPGAEQKQKKLNKFRKEDKKYIKKFLAQASLVELLSDCAPIIGVGGFFAGYFIAADTTTNDWKLLAIWAGIAGSTAYLASHISAKLGCLSSRDKRVWK